MDTEFAWEGEKVLEIDGGAARTATEWHICCGTLRQTPCCAVLYVGKVLVSLHVQRQRGRHSYQTHSLLTEVVNVSPQKSLRLHVLNKEENSD